jgi:DNA repair protein SbcD/Mre11
MRFLHVADVHLDTSFAGRSERVRGRLREASRDAFQGAVELAIREDVHAFLIAGDLFDGDRLSFQTERFLLDQARRLDEHGITVVYATGNHDPGDAGGGPRALDWPKNVVVVGNDTPQRVLVRDRQGAPIGCVTAIGHATDQETRDLSRMLPRPEGDFVEVALLHTQVHASEDAGAHHSYAPSTLSYLVRSGYDYWALGHVHARQELSLDPPVVYSGSLQGRSHGETGPRGALLVDLTDRDAAAISFRALAPVRWETLTVEALDEAGSVETLIRSVESAWRSLLRASASPSDAEWMVRVVLRGACPLWRELTSEEDRSTLADELTDVLGALEVVVVDGGLHPVLDLEAHASRIDVLGETLRLAAQLRAGETTLPGLDPESLAGVASGDRAALDAYVRELLQDADGEVATRLLGGQAERS